MMMKNIWDAVNELKGCACNATEYSERHDSIIEFIGQHGDAEDLSTYNSVGLATSNWRVVCTIEQFNECVAEMSDWLPPGWKLEDYAPNIKTEEEIQAMGKTEINAVTALYFFAGWLTSMDKPITFSSSNWATPAAEMVAAMIEANNMSGECDFDSINIPSDFEFPVCADDKPDEEVYPVNEEKAQAMDKTVIHEGKVYTIGDYYADEDGRIGELKSFKASEEYPFVLYVKKAHCTTSWPCVNLTAVDGSFGTIEDAPIVLEDGEWYMCEVLGGDRFIKTCLFRSGSKWVDSEVGSVGITAKPLYKMVKA